MYCKKCGKQIADDSVFCQFCGSAQNIIANENSHSLDKQNLSNRIRLTIRRLNGKYKFWIGVYFVWVSLNLFFVLFGNSFSEANMFFFPFSRQSHSFSYFDLKYYDVSEFVVYTILFPLLVVIIYHLWNEYHIKQR